MNDTPLGRPRFLPLLDVQGGDRFSIADITAVVAVDFARIVRIRPDDSHPRLQRWHAAIAQRPSMAS